MCFNLYNDDHIIDSYADCATPLMLICPSFNNFTGPTHGKQKACPFPHLFFNESPEPLTHIHLFDIELKYLQCTANTSSSINILST